MLHTPEELNGSNVSEVFGHQSTSFRAMTSQHHNTSALGTHPASMSSMRLYSLFRAIEKLLYAKIRRISDNISTWGRYNVWPFRKGH